VRNRLSRLSFLGREAATFLGLSLSWKKQIKKAAPKRRSGFLESKLKFA
jgi:hypothetical protein